MQPLHRCDGGYLALGTELPAEAKAVNDYAQRIFNRDAFQLSLTEAEKEMRL